MRDRDERDRHPVARVAARPRALLLRMFVSIPSPSLVEMCGHAGVDFVIVDNEHGPAGIESTEHMLRAHARQQRRFPSCAR